MKQIDILNEARNSAAMLAARMDCDMATVDAIAEQIDDKYAFILADHVLMVTLLTYIDVYAKALNELRPDVVMDHREILNTLAHNLAAKSNLLMNINA